MSSKLHFAIPDLVNGAGIAGASLNGDYTNAVKNGEIPPWRDYIGKRKDPVVVLALKRDHIVDFRF